MPNSYYDDENTNDCETPEYNLAYKLLINTKEITHKELKDTFFDHEKSQELSGLDLIKLTIIGDFATHYDHHSDMGLNLKALSSLTDSLPKDPRIWNSKAEDENSEEMWESEWQKQEANRFSLAQLAYARVKRCSNSRDPEQLKLCKNIATKLSNCKTFEPSEKSRRHYKDLEIVYNEANEEGTKKEFIRNIESLAKLAKNDQFERLAKSKEHAPNHHLIKTYATEYLVFGTSSDKFFNKVAENVKNLKTVMKSKIKEEESFEL